MNKPTVISTFAGCGGSSLGYQMAGFKELLAVEWDDHAVETFQANFPDVPVFHGDIADLSIEKCLAMAGGIEPGELTVLDGSPPCQGFSRAGKRLMLDNRNQLFREFCRLLQGLQPQAFVMENVAGMVMGKMRLIFVEILKELKACGYSVTARLLNAMYYDVPQSRPRMIFIGTRHDLGILPSHPLPETRPQSSGRAIMGMDDPGFPLTPQAQKYWPKMKPGQNASRYHPKGHLFGLYKLDPQKPCCTLIGSGGAAQVAHWSERRFIGTKERARLLTFPDGFVWPGTSREVCNRQGNSVPPNFMRAISRHVKGLLEAKVERLPGEAQAAG